MGWGETRPVPVGTAADRLAAAVRAWRTYPSTANAEALSEALDGYDKAKESARRRGEVTVHIDAPPERIRFVPVPYPSDGTGRRTGW